MAINTRPTILSTSSSSFSSSQPPSRSQADEREYPVRRTRRTGPWEREEDKLLCELVKEMGTKFWKAIGIRHGWRDGKQCRERWANHLDKKLNYRPLTSNDDQQILALYEEFGTKWALMSKKMGRPANMIKNRYYSFLCKKHVHRHTDINFQNGDEIIHPIYRRSTEKTKLEHHLSTNILTPPLSPTVSAQGMSNLPEKFPINYQKNNKTNYFISESCNNLVVSRWMALEQLAELALGTEIPKTSKPTEFENHFQERRENVMSVVSLLN
ncbi:hypothetical protein G9A89_001000 [Geosiphon pyriformis]|nr:hypothetical protein G9A89_001000 [Geosiphon pyriformis]